MKNTDLFEAIGEIDDKLIENAKFKKRKKKNVTYYICAAVVSILLIISIVGGAIMQRLPGDGIVTPIGTGTETITSTTVNGEKTFLPIDTQIQNNKYIFSSYIAPEFSSIDYNRMSIQCKTQGLNLENFVRKTAPSFLAQNTSQNYVYSPLNLYLALGMLAETTSSSNREQILNLLGYSDIDELRNHASLLWECNNRIDNDYKITCKLSNSIWLNGMNKFNQSALKKMSDIYYAKSFYGNPKDPQYSEALREWMNDATNGLLNDHIENIEMNEYTVFNLVSTLYYQACWTNKFNPDDTKTSIFHTETGDINCQFMNAKREMMYYIGDNYTKIQLSISQTDEMHIYLPNQDISIDSLINSNFWNSGNSNQEKANVTISIPKFDITTDSNLMNILPQLGITDIFEKDKADFSQIISEGYKAYIQEAKHCTRLSIDEDGCTGASYTNFNVSADSFNPPVTKEIEFILDRPFLIVLTSQANTPLFIAVINNPIQQ